MPCFASRVLLASDRLTVARVGCDGSDAARPREEVVREDAVWIVLAGRFEMRTADGRFVADPTVALLKRRGEAYSIRHPDGGDVCLSLRGEVATRLAHERPGPARLDADAFSRVALAARGLATGDPHASLAVEEALAHAFEPVRRGGVAAHERRTAEAIAHAVQLGFDQPLPLARLAAAAGVSVSHACRAFQRARGASIHQYVLEVRLRHALALVLDGDQPLAEIAAACGFASQAHLTSRFSRRFGRPPGAMRRERATPRLRVFA